MWIGYETALGRAWIEWEDMALLRLGLPGANVPVGESGPDPPGWVAQFVAGLVAYFEGHAFIPGVTAGVSLPATTKFRAAVHEVVSAVPHGSTTTYREVAEAAGHPRAARAVGAAMAHNPVAPLIPCHRVVGSGGGLRGYAGGLDMKRRLIDMEAGHA